ncbi:MAG: hypothetical protein WC586_05530 [Methanoregula sp.]
MGLLPEQITINNTRYFLSLSSMTSCSIRNQGLVFLAVLFICLFLDYATSDALSFVALHFTAVVGPVIQFEDVISILTALSLVAGLLGYFLLPQRIFNRILFVATFLSTISLFLNVAGLLRTLIQPQVNPVILLAAAAVVYISNVLVFTIWFWLLDFESQQDRCSGKTSKPVLVFPQNATSYPGYEEWTPGFVDYLFLSFHTSSTVGPTDTLVLDRKAKVAMICQVTVSLIVLVVLAARAIGILR